MGEYSRYRGMGLGAYSTCKAPMCEAPLCASLTAFLQKVHQFEVETNFPLANQTVASLQGKDGDDQVQYKCVL